MKQRIHAIDNLRGLAVLGMLATNFQLALGLYHQDPLTFWDSIFNALHGKSAACFVFCAGFTFQELTHQRAKRGEQVYFSLGIFKRALILLIIGHINLLYFNADILHFYGFYFLLALAFTSFPRTAAIIYFGMTIFAFLFHANINFWKYWNLSLLEFEYFNNLESYLMGNLFTAWHSVVPWFLFFLFGQIIAKYKDNIIITNRLFSIILLLGLSFYFLFPKNEWSPLPPNLNYITYSLSLCFILFKLLNYFEIRFRFIELLGQTSLSMYLAHIYIGMPLAILLSSFVKKVDLYFTTLFIIIFTAIYFFLMSFWLKKYQKGPAESIVNYMSK